MSLFFLLCNLAGLRRVQLQDKTPKPVATAGTSTSLGCLNLYCRSRRSNQHSQCLSVSFRSLTRDLGKLWSFLDPTD